MSSARATVQAPIGTGTSAAWSGCPRKRPWSTPATTGDLSRAARIPACTGSATWSIHACCSIEWINSPFTVIRPSRPRALPVVSLGTSRTSRTAHTPHSKQGPTRPQRRRRARRRGRIGAAPGIRRARASSEPSPETSAARLPRAGRRPIPVSMSPEKVTLREVLADQMAKDPSIVGAKVDGKIVDVHTPFVRTETTKIEPDPQRRDADGLARHPPLDRARHGRRRAAALPGHQGDHRPRDRRRLLLRLRQARAAPSPTRTSRKIEADDARDHQGGRARSAARSSRATRRARVLRQDGRDLQARDHRRHPARTKRSALQARRAAATSGSTSARARTCRRTGILGR